MTPAIEVAIGVTGLLHDFNVAGVLGLADVRTAHRLGGLYGERGQAAQLAAALAVRALRAGSVCVDLAHIDATIFEEAEESVDISTLPWPTTADWEAALARSPLVTHGPDGPGHRPLRLVDGLLYLERYWAEQEGVREALLARRAPLAPVPDGLLDPLLDRLFDRFDLAPDEVDWQREAAKACVSSRLTVIVGGPGTGKTATVARILALLADLGVDPRRVALAAPTGKAAARLKESIQKTLPSLPAAHREAIGALGATTLHGLLDWIPGGRYRRNADRPLPHEAVIVDEVSMVPLAQMGRLLEATRPEARLVLVGDPDQLASVEAGVVLSDITRAGANVVRLQHTFRYGAGIAAVADAVREGDGDRAVSALRVGREAASLVESDLLRPVGDLDGLRTDVVTAGAALVRAARLGNAEGALKALEAHRILCGHRTGPYGVARWSRIVETWIAAELQEALGDDEWYIGRPLLVTRNLNDLGLYNGDTGVVIRTPKGPRATFARGKDLVSVVPAQLDAAQTVYAMTVHKSQGSQFAKVSLILPPPESPLLTRELLYTAVTRASQSIRVLGSAEAVRAAVGRPAMRASGLAQRLGAAPATRTDGALG